MKFSPRYRFLIMFLAIWMVFEPFAITMVRANDIPGPALNTEGVDGIVAIDEVMTPSEFVDYQLALRGRTQEEAEAKAWGDWMMSMTGAYMMMDDGCSDVFSFYAAVEAMRPHIGNTPFYFQALSAAASKAALAFAFVANSAPIEFVGKVAGKTGSAVSNSFIGKAASWTGNKVAGAASRAGSKVANTRLYQKGVGFIQRKANLMNGFKRMGTMATSAQKAFSAKNVSTFLTHMSPPCGYKAGTGEGFYSYWRWVARKTNLESVGVYKKFAKKVGITTNKGSAVIGDAKGLGHTVGIGLCVLSICLDSYGIYTSEDREGGRYFSYSLVKNYVGLALGVAALVAMFCIPIVGQVAAICTLVWVGLTTIGDQIGKYNVRWKNAYTNSYQYLIDNDPEFRSFYENRASLDDEEKSASLLVAEQRFGAFLTGEDQTPANEEDQKVYDKNLKVFAQLEKNGILASYYAQKGFTLPDFSMPRLQELWQMKADYMSWKPTDAEKEKAANRGFWGKVGHYVNPMTYVSWAGDKIQSKDMKKTMEEYNIRKVFFNPDYVLMKKYQNWLAANKFKGGIFDIVGLRMEQSPFNYIPLVGIETNLWSEELLGEAFNADAFMIGVKEMVYFKEQVRMANEALENTIKDSDRFVEVTREEHLGHAQKVRKALDRLVDCFKIDADREHKDLMKDCKKAFGWRWNDDNGKPTPRKIIQIYQTDIEQSLMYDPLSIAQKAADVMLMVATIKKNLDTAKIMKETGEEKRQILADFKNEFTNYDIAKYLKEGTFLDVKGSTFMDWLSDIYPAYEEMELNTNLYMNEVEKFTGTADEANSSTRDRFLWFDKENVHPKELLVELNNELDAFKEISEKFEEIKDDVGLNMPLTQSENSEFYANVYRPNGYTINYNLEALDLDSGIYPDADE